MDFLCGAATDIGTAKKTNQDSLLIKIGNCSENNVALAILCDGMGGLDKGEIASAYVVDEFNKWITERFPIIIDEKDCLEKVKTDWNNMLVEMNYNLNLYGKRNKIHIGTTLAGLLIINDKCLIVNVGDSRTYLLNHTIEQISEDQSLIAREIKLGRINKEQALTDPRRNILLQCIGVTKDINPEFYEKTVNIDDEYLLCSDGFIHMVSEEEIFEMLSPDNIFDESDINTILEKIIKINIERNETDNITAALIKII